MTVERSICDGNIKLGGCIASSFAVTLIGITPDAVVGKKFTAYLLTTATTDGTCIYPSDSLIPSDNLYPNMQLTTNTEKSIFTGTVDSALRQKQNRKLIDVMAYDDLYFTGKRDVYKWLYNAATYSSNSITPSNVFEVMCDKMDLTIVSNTLSCNHDRILGLSPALVETVCGGRISAIELLKNSCEIMGTFGYITADGNFTTKMLKYFAEVEIPTYKALEFEEYTTDVINAVATPYNENKLEKYGYAPQGGVDNYYIASDNTLLKCCTASTMDIATNLAKVTAVGVNNPNIADLTGGVYKYRPYTCDCEYADGIDICKKVKIQGDEVLVNSFIFNITITGPSALMSSISATGNKRMEELDGGI